MLPTIIVPPVAPNPACNSIVLPVNIAEPEVLNDTVSGPRLRLAPTLFDKDNPPMVNPVCHALAGRRRRLFSIGL